MILSVSLLSSGSITPIYLMSNLSYICLDFLSIKIDIMITPSRTKISLSKITSLDISSTPKPSIIMSPTFAIFPFWEINLLPSNWAIFPFCKITQFPCEYPEAHTSLTATDK